MNDEIILLAKQGYESAYYNLYENYREMIYRLAYRFTNSQPDAEDVMQDTFIKAFQNISTFENKNENSFPAWLTQICINSSINYLRGMKKHKNNQVIPMSKLHDELISKGLSPEEFTQSKQNLALIKKAIQKLSPKQRVIFDLRYFQHRNIKEIAIIMNCSESNIKTQIFRSVSKLRKKLKPIWRDL